MHPIAMISSPVEGLLTVNGRLAGSISADAPLALPVSPFGALYLQFHPFQDEFRPMARRVVFSAGKIVETSLEGQSGLYAVEWPGGAVELELIPVSAETLLSNSDDYAPEQTERESQGAPPSPPASPTQAALALAEAAMLGLMDEAEGYLAPDAEGARQLLPEIALWDGCVPMKYAMSDGRSAVGLTRAVSERLVRVEPLYFTAIPGGAAPNYWRIDWIKIGGI